MTLTELLQEYERERAAAHRAARYESGDARPGVCRYCGHARNVSFARRLDGHARCVVSPAFMAMVLEVLERGDPGIGKEVAQLLDVTQSTLRTWYRAALDARQVRSAA